MARIGILTCTNAVQELGCSSAVCLADLRKRKGAFADYPKEEPVDLVGMLSCPGCPTIVGEDKLLSRIRALTEFRVDVIHFSNCVTELCPFKNKYKSALEAAYPKIKVRLGTHQDAITEEEFRARVKKLFGQERKTMVDVIMGRD